jgi:hypothetical protein
MNSFSRCLILAFSLVSVHLPDALAEPSVIVNGGDEVIISGADSASIPNGVGNIHNPTGSSLGKPFADGSSLGTFPNAGSGGNSGETIDPENIPSLGAPGETYSDWARSYDPFAPPGGSAAGMRKPAITQGNDGKASIDSPPIIPAQAPANDRNAREDASNDFNYTASPESGVYRPDNSQANPGAIPRSAQYDVRNTGAIGQNAYGGYPAATHTDELSGRSPAGGAQGGYISDSNSGGANRSSGNAVLNFVRGLTLGEWLIFGAIVIAAMAVAFFCR